MAASRPPATLPPEFTPLWSVLREEDERLGSRRTLARRLGVSTHTIQRILVDGDVPELRGSRSLRLVRAWARIIGSIAAYAGQDPATWIRDAGIEWDEEIAAIVEGAARSLPAGRGRQRHASRRAADDVERPIRLRIGVHPSHPPWPTPARGGPSILGVELVRRVLEARGGVVSLETDFIDESSPLSGPPSSAPAVDLVCGVPSTPLGGRPDVAFVEIPGWRARLDAVALSRSPASRPPDWDAVVSSTGAIPVLVGAHDAAGAHLGVHHRVPADRIRQAVLHERDALAPAALEALDIFSGGWVVIVSWQAVVARTVDALRAADVVAEPVEGAEDELPSRPLVVAWPSGGRLASVGDALREDVPVIAATAPGATARLYAAALIASGERSWQLDDVPAAPMSFRRALCRHLFRGLMAEAESRDSSGRPPAIVAMERTAGLLPVGWTDVIAHVTGIALTRRAGQLQISSAPHCQSCSAALTAEVNRGTSDRYCRFCSDPEGDLRPKAQVLDVLTRWIEEWQGVGSVDARRRANLLMSAMPAWSDSAS